MSIKKRLILILSMLGVLLAISFHLSFYWTIVPDLERQKALMIDKLNRKLHSALAVENKQVKALCDSWATWEGIREFVWHPSETFQKEFLSNTSFINHGLNVVLIVGTANKIIHQAAYHEIKKFFPLPLLGIQKEIDKIKESVKQTGRPFSGIVKTEYGPLLIVANPVNPPQHALLPATTHIGMILLGRFITNHRLEKAPVDSCEVVHMVTFKEKEKFQFYLQEPHLQNAVKKDFFFHEDKNEISAIYVHRDIYGSPAFLFKIESPNKFFWVAQKHTRLYILSTILSILLLCTILFIVLEKYIIKRIINISKDMQKVQGIKNISMRISEDTRHDEVSSLIANVNMMLDKIEKEKKSLEILEKQLITNEKLVSIGRLSASIAHEINNPMLAISNCIQALKKTCKQCKGEEFNLHQQAIAVSQTEINQVRKIISNLLDYHRLDVEEFTMVDLNDVIFQSLEILKWSKKLNSIKIITEKQKDFTVLGSHGKLKQVFINFILNAIEASEENKGILRIKTCQSEDPHFCEVHFIDNGPGIPAKIRKKIFEPFVTTKLEKGAGLGLYVSYKIIRSHNGEIFLKDTVNEGTYFIIKLPKKKGEEGVLP